MNWLWFGATADLAAWEARPFSASVEHGPRAGDNRDNHERVVATEGVGPPEPDGPARRLAHAIGRFDIFGPRWLTGVMRRTPVESGDTIGLSFPFVPGLRLFFAARVIERFETSDDRHWRSGFTYRTLQGHPECGDETFVVEKDLVTGQVTAALRSWSRPGIWLARLTYPLTRMLQLRAARAALDHLETIARGAPTRHQRTMLLGSHWL